MENQRLLRSYLNLQVPDVAIELAHVVVEFQFVWYVGTYVNNIGLLGNLEQLFKDKKHINIVKTIINNYTEFIP